MLYRTFLCLTNLITSNIRLTRTKWYFTQQHSPATMSTSTENAHSLAGTRCLTNDVNLGIWTSRGERGTLEHVAQWNFWKKIIIHYFSHIFGLFHALCQQFYVYTFDSACWSLYFDKVSFKDFMHLDSRGRMENFLRGTVEHVVPQCSGNRGSVELRLQCYYWLPMHGFRRSLIAHVDVHARICMLMRANARSLL
jgi:hypothetical protein